MTSLDDKLITLTREQIARIYADAIEQVRGVDSTGLSREHINFANALLNRDAANLKFLSDGINGPAKLAFERITGVVLPKNQSGTWAAICRWAGLSQNEQARLDAEAELQRVKSQLLSKSTYTDIELVEENARRLYLRGDKYIETVDRNCVLVNHLGEIGYEITKQRQSKFKRLYEVVFKQMACETPNG